MRKYADKESDLNRKLLSDEDDPPLERKSTFSAIGQAIWNRADILKLALCWALTLTTSTLLTVLK